MEDWFADMVEGRKKKAHSLAILAMWQIWKEGNARIFNNTSKNEHLVLSEIRDELSNWESASKRAFGPRNVVTVIE